MNEEVNTQTFDKSFQTKTYSKVCVCVCVCEIGRAHV